MAGKTGTAEGYGQQATSWFASHGPRLASGRRYVVVAMITESGTGADYPAPAARAVWDLLRTRGEAAWPAATDPVVHRSAKRAAVARADVAYLREPIRATDRTDMTRSPGPIRSVLLCAAVLLLAACGGEAAPEGQGSSSAKAPTTSASATSASATSASAPTSRPAATPGQQVDSKALAKRMNDASRAAKYARMTMTVPGAPGSVVADQAWVGPKRTDVRMTIDGQEILVVDGTMYLKDPQGGGRWQSIAADSNHPAAASLRNSQSLDKQLETFGKGRTTFVASERGGAHYRTVVPMSVVFPGQDQQTAGKQLTYDYWVDPKDRMVRMESDISGAPGVAGNLPGGPAAAKVVLTMSRWGVPVSIKAPPASQVTPAPEGGQPTS